MTASNLDGTADETIASHNGSLALDLQNEKIYWAVGGTIERAELDGTNVETVLETSFNLGGIAVAPIQEKIFFTVHDSEFSRVLSVNLDGSDVTEVVPEQGRIAGMAVDPLGPQVPASGRLGHLLLALGLAVSSAVVLARIVSATTWPAPWRGWRE